MQPPPLQVQFDPITSVQSAAIPPTASIGVEVPTAASESIASLTLPLATTIGAEASRPAVDSDVRPGPDQVGSNSVGKRDSWSSDSFKFTLAILLDPSLPTKSKSMKRKKQKENGSVNNTSPGKFGILNDCYLLLLLTSSKWVQPRNKR